MPNPKKQKLKKPNGPIYTAAAFLAGIFLRLFYRVKIDNQATRHIREPFVGVANHQCNLDFLITANALCPAKMRYVVTTYFFKNRALRLLLRLVAAIPKKQFIADLSATREMMRSVAGGQSIFIYPEGQLSYCGLANEFDDAIGKLIKKLKVPVLNVKIRGGFLSCPKWSRRRRFPARIEAVTEVLLTAKQVETMSAEEIFEAVRQGISYNEFDWQRERMIPAKKNRLTEGLQNILYSCPHCKTDFSITAKDTRLICEACGYEVRLNRYGLFEQSDPNREVIFGDIAAWFQMQRAAVKEQAAGGYLPFCTPATLYSVDARRGGYRPRGAGELTLGREGIRYSGTRDGAPFGIFFPVEHQTAVTHSTSIWGIDFGMDGVNYGLAPDDPRKMIKLAELYAEIRRLRDAEKPK